jgi:hypothetical protein
MEQTSDFRHEKEPEAKHHFTRKGWIVGSTTLACALGGALAGALAFSSFPGGLGHPANSELSNGTAQVPGDTGSLCSSTHNTPTAADTALSCESYGTRTYSAALARVERRELVIIEASRARSLAASEPRRTTSSAAVVPLAASVPAGIGTPSPPSASSPGSSRATCLSFPAPSGVPSLGSGSISISSSAGKLSVKVSSKTVTVCGKLPSAPKLPSLKRQILSILSTAGTATGSTKNGAGHKSSNPVQTIVKDLKKGLGGL